MTSRLGVQRFKSGFGNRDIVYGVVSKVEMMDFDGFLAERGRATLAGHRLISGLRHHRPTALHLGQRLLLQLLQQEEHRPRYKRCLLLLSLSLLRPVL